MLSNVVTGLEVAFSCLAAGVVFWLVPLADMFVASSELSDELLLPFFFTAKTMSTALVYVRLA